MGQIKPAAYDKPSAMGGMVPRPVVFLFDFIRFYGSERGGALSTLMSTVFVVV